jgi:hypothetical protein
MGYRVFFSHNASDRAWAKWIAGQAQLVGIEVYLCEHDPQPGVSMANYWIGPKLGVFSGFDTMPGCAMSSSF